ncbi:MAG TPA: tail fiber protein [Thermoanaerobaculia bacterium]
MFAGNFPPAGWAFCEGQLVAISENDALFVVLGTTYGGDGENTFALPNLRVRAPIHQGNGHIIGETGGVESVTLTTQQIPVHTHALIGSTDNGAQATPANNILASSVVLAPYANETASSPMAANAVSPVGGSQPHENMQPYLCLNYIISLYGEFPHV